MPRSRKRKHGGKSVSGKGMFDPTQRRSYDPGKHPQPSNLMKQLARSQRVYRPKGGQRGR